MSDTPKATPEERAKYVDSTSPDKEVSQKASTRLNLAADAIAATKRAISHQGNQVPALKATNMNSRYRLRAMRDDRCWEYTPEAAKLASANKEADVAARADIAHGGNCGEHSWVAYHYLREHAKGETINRISPSFIDHAFTIIGDLKTDKDNELAVSDPWTNSPIACLWEDHFARGRSKGDRSDLGETSMVADGNSYKSAIAAGLRLTEYGKFLINNKDSDPKTKELTDDWKNNHFWNHDDTRAGGSEYSYRAPAPEAQAGQQQEQQSRE